MRDGPPPVPLPKTPRERMARVTRRLVHACLFQRMLENGQARHLAGLARKFSLTRARVTQILNHTLLAPDIQTETLKLPLLEPGRDPLAERRVRTVLREVLWEKQRRLWRNLLPKEQPAMTESAVRPLHRLAVRGRVNRNTAPPSGLFSAVMRPASPLRDPQALVLATPLVNVLPQRLHGHGRRP